MVAATSRTSTFTVWVPPSRSISPSCSARSSFTCAPTGISPTSSRKRVPPLARSNRPGLRAVAPVKAPFSTPNSSASRSVSGKAPQLTATNGPAARPESSWSARAASSLPVPDSPSRSTVAVEGAACFSVSRKARNAGDWPTRLRWAPRSARRAFSSWFSATERVALERLLHRLQQHVALERLGEEVVRAVLHRADRRLHRAVGGHEDHLDVRTERPGGGEELLPVHARHHRDR